VLQQADRPGLRSDLETFPLESDLVVFCEATQRVISLNESAAFIFRALQRGAAVKEVERAIASEGLVAISESGGWVRTTIDAFRSQGMLADQSVPEREIARNDDGAFATHRVAGMPEYELLKHVTERRYQLLDTSAVVRFAHLAQVRLVESVIGHLATTRLSANTILIEIHGRVLENGHMRSDVYCDGEAVGFAPRLSMLAPIVKAALWQKAINAYDFLFYLHAGVLGLGTSCLLLPASAGSGKSSLTAALTRSGLDYLSDEVALLERTTFRVPPMPFAICVKNTGWEVIAPHYADFDKFPIHDREDGKRVRYIPPPATVPAGALPVSHIIFPRFQPEGPTALVPLARSAALGRLMEECVALRQRLDRETVDRLVRWMAGLQCFALSFSALDDAVRLIRREVQGESASSSQAGPV